MILKDFDIYWPIKISTKTKSFQRQARHLSALYERSFEKLRDVNCWKIAVECVDVIKQEKIYAEDVCQIEIIRDPEIFLKLDKQDKKKWLLDSLMEGCDKVSKNESWDFTLFEKARDKVIEANYVNEWYWKKQKSSPDRKLKAKIFCKHDIDDFQIFLHVFNKKNELIKEKFLLKEEPDEFLFNKYFGDLKWLNNSKVRLEYKDNSGKIDIEIQTNAS